MYATMVQKWCHMSLKLSVEMNLQDCIFKLLVGLHKNPQEENAMGRHIFPYQRQLHVPIHSTPFGNWHLMISLILVAKKLIYIYA